MSAVHSDIWFFGHVVAYMSPIEENVNYAYMNDLCERMHTLEPAVKFDNREWLGRVHYLLYLGDYTLALKAFEKATQGDGWKTWNVCEPGVVSQPQMFDEAWQNAQNKEPTK